MDLLTWDDVKEQIKDTDNSILLGNGFSISYKADDFNQKSILKEIDFLAESIDVSDIEECIKDTQKLVQDSNTKTVPQDIIREWIKEKLQKAFIEKLFNKMSATIKDKKDYDEKTLKPYKEFLSHYKKFFSLNYDPLLYWMSLKFMNKGDKDINAVLDWETKKANSTAGTKNYEKAEGKIKECYAKCINAIRENIFIKKICKKDYTVQVMYDNECLLNETLEKMEEDKVISLKKVSSKICENIEAAASKKESLKNEYEKIELQTKSDYDSKRAEIISNKEDGLEINFTDGFLNNSETKKLEWSEQNEQNAFFLHGAFHILEKGGKIIKIKADDTNTMLSNIKKEWVEGYDSLTVLESEHKNKIQEIDASDYLKYCFTQFKSINGILVTFGVSFLDSDNHIIDAINSNPNLEKIFIGCYDNPSEALLEKFKDNSKIFYFSTKGIL